MAGEATPFLDRGSWSSWIDATILHALSERMRMSRGEITTSRNHGADEWAAFFEARLSRPTETELLGLWAVAESAATEFGREVALDRGATPTAGELAVDEWASAWRSGVRWRSAPPTPAELLTPEPFIVGMGHIAGSTFFDPRLPAPTVQTLTMIAYFAI